MRSKQLWFTKYNFIYLRCRNRETEDLEFHLHFHHQMSSKRPKNTHPTDPGFVSVSEFNSPLYSLLCVYVKVAHP